MIYFILNYIILTNTFELPFHYHISTCRFQIEFLIMFVHNGCHIYSTVARFIVNVKLLLVYVYKLSLLLDDFGIPNERS